MIRLVLAALHASEHAAERRGLERHGLAGLFLDELPEPVHLIAQRVLRHHVAAELIAEKRKIYKGVSPNVDFYSGFVYDMLGLPRELYTPLFAVARIAGWSAHRIEELTNGGKIIRPGYQAVAKRQKYVPLESRKLDQ